MTDGTRRGGGLNQRRKGGQDLSIHWRGHVLLFNRKRWLTYEASAGARLLLIFVLLEGVVGPAFRFSVSLAFRFRHPGFASRFCDRRAPCPWCGEKRKLIALLTDGKVVRALLEHLGLPTAAPVLAPARSPPELEFAG